ncbi:MAG TPA: thioredoxin family protein [bacterium]|nr:thioredoxin family protein [bacterium]HQL60705.1 thioredoxin family protein [bacterium]
MQATISRTWILAITSVLPVFIGAGIVAATDAATVECLYPGLASGVFMFAEVGELPDGVLVRAATIEISIADIESNTEIPKEQREKYAFHLAEQAMTEKLLLYVAGNDSGGETVDLSNRTDRQIVHAYLRKRIPSITVTVEEAKTFYEENRELFGEAAFDQIHDHLKEYIRQQKQQAAIEEHIRGLGKAVSIVVSATWVDRQAQLAIDNPVDQARRSGKPSLVDFGATGCVPCDMMAPILNTLRKKYDGRVNVVFVHVGEEQVLASRYGVRSIPVQIFFDENGKELFRHTGVLPQAEIEQRLATMAVK